ncbi:MAG TPA: hypothetical protein VNT32_04040 [Thermoleophilaceae bacterium]|nr:hypothetical protein [Thermoleophilaceae bacterium]
MGKRSRRRGRDGGGAAPDAGTTTYADDGGNSLTLRNAVSPGTVEKLRRLDATPGSTLEDRAARRTELLFERMAVRWEIAGLPLESQKELLGRYRMASAEERRWVAATLDRHAAEHQSGLAG